jgi:hypothetical protein
VLLQHFMGNNDNYDPAITDHLAEGREVILTDNAGVGLSTGAAPRTVAAMARDAASLIDALGLEQVDKRGRITCSRPLSARALAVGYRCPSQPRLRRVAAAERDATGQAHTALILQAVRKDAPNRARTPARPASPRRRTSLQTGSV